MLDIKLCIDRWESYVIEKRREFHQIPEASLVEFKTCRKIMDELTAMGLNPRQLADTGVVADITGAYPGKTVGLRADIDGLSVTEQTGVPYASQHEGFMHACGHDTHIAMLLGAAQILNELRGELHGSVRLIFEPGEEVAKGALKMIRAGALEGVDTILGLHIWADVPAGKISAEPGPRMASADWITIDIQGKSCHGGMPEQGVDAVVAGAAVVNSIQSIVSRETTPLEPIVVTLGEFYAGERNNVVAGTARLTGTVRTFNNDIRKEMPAILERVIKSTAAAYRAEATLGYEWGNSPLTNDPACATLAAKAVEKVLGCGALYHYPQTTGGENFAEYLNLVPGAFLFVGTGNPEKGAVHPQHSCYYTVDESVLINGSCVAAQYAFDYLCEYS